MQNDKQVLGNTHIDRKERKQLWFQVYFMIFATDLV